MPFVLKTVNMTGRLGTDLEELRRRAGWSRADACRHTKLAESTISLWEEDRWDEIEDAAYVERMLRAYVMQLGGSEPYFIGKYREAIGGRRERKTEELLPRPRRIGRMDLAVMSRALTVAGFSVFVLLLGGYVFVQARAITAPPPLQIIEPLDGERIDGPRIEVRGVTLYEASVTVNGERASVQPDGTFSLTMAVPRGTTTITISAQRRHGREARVIRRVIFDRPLPVLPGMATSTS